MVCYHEIMYDKNGSRQLLVSQDEWELAEGDTDEDMAREFVPPGMEIVNVAEYCDDDLLELLVDFYPQIMRGDL